MLAQDGDSQCLGILRKLLFPSSQQTAWIGDDLLAGKVRRQMIAPDGPLEILRNGIAGKPRIEVVLYAEAFFKVEFCGCSIQDSIAAPWFDLFGHGLHLGRKIVVVFQVGHVALLAG